MFVCLFSDLLQRVLEMQSTKSCMCFFQDEDLMCTFFLSSATPMSSLCIEIATLHTTYKKIDLNPDKNISWTIYYSDFKIKSHPSFKVMGTSHL